VLGGTHRGGVAGYGLGPWAAEAQQDGDAGGEGDDVGVLAGSCGVIEAGQQVGTLDPDPG
jgi:hypothetical protein